MPLRGSTALGAFVGLAMFAAVGALGLRVLEACWPSYAAATLLKAYTPAMLLARLGVAFVACAAAGAAAARASNAAPWAAGLSLLVLSSYIHISDVWYDYPVWYHVIYLALIVPATGLAGAVAPWRR